MGFIGLQLIFAMPARQSRNALHFLVPHARMRDTDWRGDKVDLGAHGS